MSAPGHAPRGTAPTWPALPATFVWLALVLVAGAGIVGLAARIVSAPKPAPPPAPPRVVDLGAVSVPVPAGWEAAGSRVAGVPEAGPGAAAFAPVPGLSSRALIVLAPFDDPTLVPGTLRALAGSGVPRRTTLAGMPAWTYRRHALSDGRIAQVTLAPTTAGSLTVVCIAQDAAWSGAEGCADAVGAATLHGATPLIPSRSLAFRRVLVPALERLNARRGELRARLRSATTRPGQARFAARLDRAYVRALSALSAIAPASGAPRRVVTELRRTARSYGRLSVAARNGWPGRYRQARLAIRRSDRALGAALARVG